MAYRFIINTDKYKDRRCSVQNWEPGTMNDYMHAINGLKFREDNLSDLRNRIHFFSGHGYTDSMLEWLEKRGSRNTITYRDRLCDMNRTQEVKAYGFAQGCFDIQRVIDEVVQNGSSIIPFKWFYDSRQYVRNMDGCFIKIEKC